MSGMNFMEKLLDGVEVEWKALGYLEDSKVIKLGRGKVISSITSALLRSRLAKRLIFWAFALF